MKYRATFIHENTCCSLCRDRAYGILCEGFIASEAETNRIDKQLEQALPGCTCSEGHHLLVVWNKVYVRQNFLPGERERYIINMLRQLDRRVNGREIREALRLPVGTVSAVLRGLTRGRYVRKTIRDTIHSPFQTYELTPKGKTSYPKICQLEEGENAKDFSGPLD